MPQNYYVKCVLSWWTSSGYWRSGKIQSDKNEGRTLL